MKYSDLQVGDVIFFERQYLDEDRPNYLDHVAMVTRVDKDKNEIRITHSINQDNPMPEKPNALYTTTLRELNNQRENYVDSETKEQKTERFNIIYKVMRCKDSALAERAALLIVAWSQYLIPFDQKRLQEMLENEEKIAFMTGARACQTAMNLYQNGEGKFRAIKFAARSDVSLTLPGIDGEGRGLICFMSIILAFQVAELRQFVRAVTIIDLQASNEALNNSRWPGDKYANLRQLENCNYLPESVKNAYVAYVGKLRSKKNVEIDPARFVHMPSIMHWNPISPVNPIEFNSSVMAVDCKKNTVAGLYHYLDAVNHLSWENKGIVCDFPAFRPRTPERIIHRALMAANFERANSAVSEMRMVCASPNSTGRSPSVAGRSPGGSVSNRSFASLASVTSSQSLGESDSTRLALVGCAENDSARLGSVGPAENDSARLALTAGAERALNLTPVNKYQDDDKSDLENSPLKAEEEIQAQQNNIWTRSSAAFFAAPPAFCAVVHTNTTPKPSPKRPGEDGSWVSEDNALLEKRILAEKPVRGPFG